MNTFMLPGLARMLPSLALAGLLASACVETRPADSSPAASLQGQGARAADVVPSEVSPEPCPSPLRIGLLLDKSGSAPENAVPQATVEDLDALIRLVDTCAGGEIAIGALCAVSGDKPFVRLYLPARSSSALPQSPAATNPFSANRQARTAAAATAKRKAEEAELAELRRGAIERFRAEALPLIEAPATCRRTDVIGGVNRLQTYLAEPTTVADPLLVAVVLSDAADNVRRQTLRRDAGADVLHVLVGGAPDAGALAPLNPERFENVAAALRWIGATARVPQTAPLE